MLREQAHDRKTVLAGKSQGSRCAAPNAPNVVPTDLLRTFISIAEVGSFTKAGEAVRLTQPAISAQMKRLEHMIGADLFERGAPGVRLTNRGREVLKFARRMMSINDQILACARSQSAPTVRVGLANIFAGPVLQALAADRRTREANARLRIQCDNSHDLLQGIRNGYLELACVIGDDPEVVDAPCSWTERLAWTRAPNVALGRGGAVPLIASPNRVLPDWIAIEALAAADLGYEIVLTARDRLARHAAAVLGLGYLAMARRTIPPTLVEEEQGALPPLRSMTAGIVTRSGVDRDELSGLIATLETAIRCASLAAETSAIGGAPGL